MKFIGREFIKEFIVVSIQVFRGEKLCAHFRATISIFEYE